MTSSNQTPTFKVFVKYFSRFFPLFGVSQNKDTTVSPLNALMRLLNNPKCSTKVTGRILEILENLLTLEDFEAMPDVDVININESTVPCASDDNTGSILNH